jgi:hypothetical protein
MKRSLRASTGRLESRLQAGLPAPLVLASLIFAGPIFAQSPAPEIPYDSAPNLLKLPEHIHIGEAAGVATNSKGHVFVYTRTGDMYATTGTSRTFTHGGARLFEFDANGKFVREIGQGVYAFLFAQVVRIDPQDNIWVVDRGSSMVIKFDPDGRVKMPMGRKPEAVFVGARGGGRGEGAPAPLPGSGSPGDLFSQPTDVAWDSAGNIFIADGYGNSRIVPRGTIPANSTFRTRLRPTLKAMCTWRIAGTREFRYSTTTATSRLNIRMRALHGRSAFRRGLINISTARTRTKPTRWIMARFTKWSWMDGSWANSGERANS